MQQKDPSVLVKITSLWDSMGWGKFPHAPMLPPPQKIIDRTETHDSGNIKPKNLIINSSGGGILFQQDAPRTSGN